MKISEIFFIGIGLSMDAFAVSICKGFSIKEKRVIYAIKIASYFGFFQAFMPLIGFYLGTSFHSIVEKFTPFIAFMLLTFIGGNMIHESIHSSSEKDSSSTQFAIMLPLAIATSIDALAVGITFAFFEINIYLAIFIIGLITFLFSFFGVIIGNHFGNQFQSKSGILGGIILIFMGIKILIEHFTL